MDEDLYSPRTFTEKEMERVLKKHKLLDKIRVVDYARVDESLDFILPKINGTGLNIYTNYNPIQFRGDQFPVGKIFSIDEIAKRTPKIYGTVLGVRDNDDVVWMYYDDEGKLTKDVDINLGDLRANQKKSISDKMSKVPHSEGELFVPAFEEVLKLYKHYAK